MNRRTEAGSVERGVVADTGTGCQGCYVGRGPRRGFGDMSNEIVS